MGQTETGVRPVGGGDIHAYSTPVVDISKGTPGLKRSFVEPKYRHLSLSPAHANGRRTYSS